ncbi:MAG: c-type cytochrome [Opitutus sp.]|nr:c-type cytochrome [Opitutus sp.]
MNHRDTKTQSGRFLFRYFSVSLCLSGSIPATSAAEPSSKLLPTAPPGVTVELFARDPLVRNPCAMAFDARGRLFVGQGPQYRNPKPDTPGDTVEILIDTDGDGIADKTKTFARGLNCIQGLAWHGRDLWIANSPDLTIVRDLDGDDEADEYVLLYTDLGNIEHALHGLNFAPDGKVYMSKGNSKGLNQPGRIAPQPFRELFGLPTLPGSPDLPQPRTFTKQNYRATYQDPKDDWGRHGGVLRCDPDGTQLEIVARGLRNPWDIAFDSGFNWLGTDNDQSDGDRIFMAFFGADFGWAHKWSPDWTGARHLPTVPISGPVFTGSGTGIVFADTPPALPASFHGVWFINDYLHRITFAYRPRWDGALLQPSGGKWEPFLRASGSLFNPVDIELGPDGALYVTGWGSVLGGEFKDGKQTNEGRVWRVAATGTPRVPVAAHRAEPYGKWTFAQLTADLGSWVATWRADASAELVRRSSAVRADLVAFATKPNLSTAQETWALWTLGRIALDDVGLDTWFGTTGAKLSLNARIQSLRIVAHRMRESKRPTALPPFVAAALTDSEPRVRFAALQSIGRARRPALLDAVCAVVATETDRLSFYAAWHTLLEIATPDTLREKLRDSRGGVRRAALLALLDRGNFDESGVRALVNDADAATAGLAGLWLARLNGNPLLDISPPPGDFVGRVNVKIVPGLKPAIVRYTLDGTEPKFAKGPEGAKLTFTETTTLKAALFVNEKKVGPTSVGVYRKIVPATAPPAITLTPPAAPVTLAQVTAALPQAEISQGRAIFHTAGCIACHRFGSEGGAFAPDLTGLGARGNVERVIRSILEPSAEIVEGFGVHTYTLRDGKSLAGRILEEDQSRFVIIQPNNETASITRADIVKDEALPISAMPPADSIMSATDLAALVAWLVKP